MLARRKICACDGCDEEEHVWSYYCDECDFDLHPKRALKEDKGANDDSKGEDNPHEGWNCCGETRFQVL